MEETYYPRILRRLQAMFIDSLLVVALIYFVAFLPRLDDWAIIKPIAVVLAIFALEPGLVSGTGGTVGHHLMKMRVVRASDRTRLNLFAATVRFVLKVFLGTFSFIWVLATRRHQSLHDLAARSVVVYENAVGLPASEKLVARASLSETYVMPSAWRRAVVIIGYAISYTVLQSIVIAIVVTDDCMMGLTCGAWDQIVVTTFRFTWIFAVGAIIVFGCRGQLFGARRSERT